MTSPLVSRLREALAGSPLEDRVDLVADPFASRRGGDAAVSSLAGKPLLGLARALVTSVEAARFLAHRPRLLERIAYAGPEALRLRAEELAAAAAAAPADLEGALDALRLLRRDETLFAASLHMGGVVPFDEASRFLSRLAEEILRATLVRAQASTGTRRGACSLAVLGMGKIGGREFTYHSDLDLIFLCAEGFETLAQASRVAQRLIAYLTTRTGAGVAYAVDSRLRPSGGQGLLVTTLDSFERYQRTEAQTWEHLVLMRARVVAGEAENAAAALQSLQRDVAARGVAPWAEVADMRRKVEDQRGQEAGGRIAFKTGSGGLMDVDFLAAGALLERGPTTPRPAVPSNGALLRAAAPGKEVEQVLEAYGALRRVEACARWVAGRATEVLDPQAESYPLVAAVATPGAPPGALAERVAAARSVIRRAFSAVVDAGTIGALQSRLPGDGASGTRRCGGEQP
jgi:glutamate-ammonia-ligase adenylyltransferase